MKNNFSKFLFSSNCKKNGFLPFNLYAQKQWPSLESKYIINSHQRCYSVLAQKMFHPSIIENINMHESGDQQSFEWRMHFSHKNVPSTISRPIDNKEHPFMSPWHDIPLGFNDTHLKKLLFHYVNEIPKGDRAKIECATKEKWNPMKQDIKKGALRFFKYGDLPFNYGFIPQTFEDPTLESKYSDIKGLKGDGDPIDVVEISDSPLQRGNVVPIKVLGVLGLIDEGETDWKIIGIRADHPKALKIHTIDDANEVLGKDYKSLILDWFENYKVPDGKPQNKFSHNKQYQSPEMGIEIIEECHHQWQDLLARGPHEKTFALDSHALKHLGEAGLIGNKTSTPQQRIIPYFKFPDVSHTAVRSTHDDIDLTNQHHIHEHSDHSKSKH